VKISANVRMGININDSGLPWSQWILDGIKTIETRNSNTLKSYVGKTVGVVQTGKGPAHLVGFITLGEPKIYRTREQWAADRSKHRIPAGSDYDFVDGSVKYGYPVMNPQRITPIPVKSRGMVSRFIGDLI